MHELIHACMHAYIHTYIYTYKDIYRHAYIHTYTHIHIRIYMSRLAWLTSDCGKKRCHRFEPQQRLETKLVNPNRM